MKKSFFIVSILIIISALIYYSYNKFNNQDKKIDTLQVVKIDTQILQKQTINNLVPDTSNQLNSNSYTAEVSLNDSTNNKSQKQIKVIAYYFHPTARCETCLNIENYAKEVFDTKFGKEKNNLKMVWKSLNIEDSLNEHFIKDFELEFSSLIIARYDNNHRKNWKNLEKVWSLVTDKEKYMTYVKTEIQQFTKPILEEIKNED